MLEKLSYSEFRKFFPLDDTSFSKSKTQPKIILGKIFGSTTLARPIDRPELLEQVEKDAGVKLYISTNASGSMLRGSGDQYLCWALYFYLHLHHEDLTELDDLDRSILNGKTFKENFGRTVNGEIYDSKILYQKENKSDSSEHIDQHQRTIKPADQFKWPRYVSKKEAEDAEKDLPKGGGESIWLNPYNHHSIPLEGRDEEIKTLDEFVKADENFLIAYVIAPSGAGKTRLVSQWMRKLVADPNDTEGIEDKFSGWDAGLVESRNDKVWKDWQPQCNTLLVIDYTYNYDDVIKAIADKGKECRNGKIRLLILDHIKPKNLSGDVAYGKAYGNPRDRGTSGDISKFEYKTLSLAPNENSPDLLSAIIARVASLFASDADKKYEKSDDVIQRATQTLLSMKNTDDANLSNENNTLSNGTPHPLFAALMGQTLGVNPDSDVTKLKRHDLIEQYFEPEHRIPWKESKQNAYWDTLGAWIGSYVSVATLLRGVEFDRLHNHLPPALDGVKKPHAVRLISQISGRLVSDDKKLVLKPLEPDILGETFFLKFLNDCKHHDHVMEQLYNMLCEFEAPVQQGNIFGDSAIMSTLIEHLQTEYYMIDNFIETTGRLVRNLINDDQNTEFAEDGWKNLEKFLDSENFTASSKMRKAVSLILCDLIGQMQKAGFSHEIINTFARNIQTDDLAYLSSEAKYYERTAESASGYLNWRFEESSIFGKLEDELVRIIDSAIYRSYSGWSPIMVASTYCHINTLRVLLGNGADVNHATPNNGATALMAAVGHEHLEILSTLVAHPKINLNMQTNNGASALVLAAVLNNGDSVKLLLEAGANPTINDNNDLKASDYALQEANNQELHDLLKQAEMDWIAKHGDQNSNS